MAIIAVCCECLALTPFRGLSRPVGIGPAFFRLDVAIYAYRQEPSHRSANMPKSLQCPQRLPRQSVPSTVSCVLWTFPDRVPKPAPCCSLQPLQIIQAILGLRLVVPAPFQHFNEQCT